jgi:hypothetical protein
VADTIGIRISPTISSIGLVRALATALAARLDFTYDQITDLHLAIDEICSRLLDTTVDPEALEVTFETEADRLFFLARAHGPAKPDHAFLNPWSEKILRAVVDGFDVLERDGRTTVEVHVRRTA